MKHLSLSSGLLFPFIFLFSSTLIQAQDCSKYYILEEGASFEYTLKDKKGKADGTTKYSVKSVQNTAEGTQATMEMEILDKKGNEAIQSSYDIFCSTDAVRIDFKSLMNAQMLSQYKDMEVEMSGTDLLIPNDLAVGDALPDANIQMKMNMGAMNMNMEISQTNRKVEKSETISTAAGTFECLVIYSEAQSKMMMANRSFPSRMWLAEGVGLVKQETYNKKGNLMSSMELSALSR